MKILFCFLKLRNGIKRLFQVCLDYFYFTLQKPIYD